MTHEIEQLIRLAHTLHLGMDNSSVYRHPLLFLYEDRLEKAMEFYPQWVSDLLTRIPKLGITIEINRDMTRAIEGIYMSLQGLESLARRDSKDTLGGLHPKYKSDLSNLFKGSAKIDDIWGKVLANTSDSHPKLLKMLKSAVSSYRGLTQDFVDNLAIGIAQQR